MKKFFKQDFENYSRRALLALAFIANALGWVALLAITWGACKLIEWWTA